MRFSIVTPSFKQLDYLGCCIASVADQGTENGGRRTEDGGQGENGGMCESGKGALLRSVSAGSLSYTGLAERLSVEHIVQDAGSPGIEEFAEKTAERLLRQYGGERVTKLAAFELLHLRTSHGYTLRIFKEPDEGMYDAVNKGLKKGTGKICAYLNCDEQYLSGALGWVAHWFGEKPRQEVLFGDAIIVNPACGYICSRRAMVPQPLHALTSGNLSIFTSSTFFRSRLLDQGFVFDKKWKDVGDADWALRMIKAGISCRAPGIPLSTFAETGDNRNMRPQALREKEALRRSAPAWARILAPLILAAYRIRRLWAGAYSRRSVQYAIYMMHAPAVRCEFGPFHSVARWPRHTKGISP